jgi:N-acetylmuramoyl-L-alanine amidase
MSYTGHDKNGKSGITEPHEARDSSSTPVSMPIRVITALISVILIGVSMGIYAKEKSEEKSVSPSEITIVVDAGHGGSDPGKVAEDGTLEKNLNLAVSQKLVEKLTSLGFNVIVTRDSDTSLAEDGVKNEKRSDMANRLDIFNEDGVSCLVSIHHNSFTDSSVSGAQVFYHSNSETGENLANIVQSKIASDVDTGNTRQAKNNDSYYILKNSSCTGIIVECGFMSNPDELKTLCDDAYQDKMAAAICAGICEYYNVKPSSADSRDGT